MEVTSGCEAGDCAAHERRPTKPCPTDISRGLVPLSRDCEWLTLALPPAVCVARRLRATSMRPPRALPAGGTSFTSTHHNPWKAVRDGLGGLDEALRAHPELDEGGSKRFPASSLPSSFVNSRLATCAANLQYRARPALRARLASRARSALGGRGGACAPKRARYPWGRAAGHRLLGCQLPAVGLSRVTLVARPERVRTWNRSVGLRASPWRLGLRLR